MRNFDCDENIAKVIKSRKSKRMLTNGALYGSIVGEIILAMLLAFNQVPAGKFFSLTSVLCGILSISYNSKESMKEKTRAFFNKLSSEIRSKIDDDNLQILSFNDITIVPKNIKIGEDLEAINIVPIFKEGKYIIIKKLFSTPIMLAQYEENGRQVVKMLDEEEASEEFQNLDANMKRKIDRKISYYTL